MRIISDPERVLIIIAAGIGRRPEPVVKIGGSFTTL
jgi:hypothetical protein